MRMKTFYAAALAAATTIAVASAASVPWTAAKAKVGEAAPAFALTDTDGNTVNLSDFKGKTVVLEWFCPQCPWSGRQSGKSVHSTGQVNDLIKGIKAADENAPQKGPEYNTAKPGLETEIGAEVKGPIYEEDPATSTDLKGQFTQKDFHQLTEIAEKLAKAASLLPTPEQKVADDYGFGFIQ